MQRSEIEQKINDFLISEFEVERERISSNARLREDLGLDSLDFVDVVVVIKRAFGFVSAPQEMQSILTLNDLYNYVEKRVDAL